MLTSAYFWKRFKIVDLAINTDENASTTTLKLVTDSFIKLL